MDDFEPFHSAVNRIPVLRNIATRAAALGNLSPELFGEKQFIPGHDRLCADRWSGSIDLEMTVRFYRSCCDFGDPSAAHSHHCG